MEGCMVNDLSVKPIVIEQPESKYASNTEYQCPRCGHSFSSRWVTAQDPNTCVFDNQPKPEGES